MEFHYGAGVGYQISPVFGVLAESTGTTQFSTENGTNTMEIDAGVRISPLSTGLAVTVGGGVGVLEGVGVPLARGIVGIMYVNEASDQDGDGIADASDACPTKAEDKDGFEDKDGCPDPDNDKDSVADENDKCPDKPETINGVADTDGCPDDVKDSDADGIPDANDKCPQQAGQLRTQEFYGCPDTDGDGVADPQDKCPNREGKTRTASRTPTAARIRTTTPTASPTRATSAATTRRPRTASRTRTAAPTRAPPTPSKPKLVEVGQTEIKILQRVEFANGSDKVQGAQSFAVLDAVADVLKQRKSIQLVEIAGHTDNAGNAAQNKALSQKRAEAVKTYLVGKGVEADRLKPVGYGQEKPIGDNAKADGRQQNRRVEFNIQKKPDAAAAHRRRRRRPDRPLAGRNIGRPSVFRPLHGARSLRGAGAMLWAGSGMEDGGKSGGLHARASAVKVRDQFVMARFGRTSRDRFRAAASPELREAFDTPGDRWVDFRPVRRRDRARVPDVRRRRRGARRGDRRVCGRSEHGSVARARAPHPQPGLHPRTVGPAVGAPLRRRPPRRERDARTPASRCGSRSFPNRHASTACRSAAGASGPSAWVAPRRRPSRRRSVA